MTLDDLTKYLCAARADLEGGYTRTSPDLDAILAMQDAIAEYVAARAARHVASLNDNDALCAAAERERTALRALREIAGAR